MNLVIDIGNTFVKLAVFSGGDLLIRKSVEQKYAVKKVQKILKDFPKLKHAIIASVGKTNKSIESIVSKELKTLNLDLNTKLPFKNRYETPKSLGVDRIALVSACVGQYPKNNTLVIDAGTCITYDFINEKREYYGGAISPGLLLRYQSLHNFTANLPLLKTKYPENLIGNSTPESMHSGVVNGVLKEIDGVIDEYLEKYEDLTVILTGGDTDFLAKRLKNSIFADSNFLLEGLNFILEYNTD